MRIYLTHSMQVGAVSYPCAGFYNAPDELAEKWIAELLAFAATDDNKVTAYVAGSDEEQVIDFDAGHKIAPEHSPVPIQPPVAPIDGGEGVI